MTLEDKIMRPIIVGAGPIGSYVAQLLKDLDPIIIERKKNLEGNAKCTGLMSVRLREITPYEDDIILNKIYGAKFFSENNKARLAPKRVMAHVIDRAKYDEWMNQQYKGKTHFSERFIKYESGVVTTEVILDKKTYKKNTRPLY